MVRAQMMVMVILVVVVVMVVVVEVVMLLMMIVLVVVVVHLVEMVVKVVLVVVFELAQLLVVVCFHVSYMVSKLLLRVLAMQLVVIVRRASKVWLLLLLEVVVVLLLSLAVRVVRVEVLRLGAQLRLLRGRRLQLPMRSLARRRRRRRRRANHLLLLGPRGIATGRRWRRGRGHRVGRPGGGRARRTRVLLGQWLLLRVDCKDARLVVALIARVCELALQRWTGGERVRSQVAPEKRCVGLGQVLRLFRAKRGEKLEAARNGACFVRLFAPPPPPPSTWSPCSSSSGHVKAERAGEKSAKVVRQKETAT